MLLVLADRIHTLAAAAGPAGTGRGPVADALLVRDGRVVAVGARTALEAEAGTAARLDLRGATVTPGLSDAHVHLIEWALARREVDLSDAASPEEAAEAVARKAREAGALPASMEHPARAWVRGGGWDPQRWGGFPTREALDRRIADRPVALRSHDMHGLWVNGRALESAGITAGTPDPAGGRIVRDAAGEPTGVLLENAVPLVERAIPAPTAAELRAAVLDAQMELHRLGITGVHAFPGVHAQAPDALRLLEALRDEGRLRLRVAQQLPASLLDEAVRLGLRSGAGDDWIRVGAVKLFLDGTLGSRTAWLRAPYEGDADTGIQVLAAADFRDAVRRAAAAGLAAAAHAIGDAAVVLALDVLGDPAVRNGALPHRIEHVQLCPPERLGDAGRAGIVCSMQPAHLMTDWRSAERHWGRGRSRGAFAFRSLLRGGPPWGSAGASMAPSGAVLAFGSDAPVEPVDPRLGLYAATTRQDLGGEPAGGWFAEERLTVEEALRAYTIGPARAAGRTGRSGPLVPGGDADFVAWDRDPLAAAGRELLALRCIATVVAGGVVWRDGGIGADADAKAQGRGFEGNPCAPRS